MSEAIREVEQLRPGPGDVLALHLNEATGDEELRQLAAQLSGVAARTGCTVLLLPEGVALDLIDEREMLARGWMRVSPVAHTSAQLTQITEEPSPNPSTAHPTLSPIRR